MKAIIIRKPYDVRVEEVDQPRPEADQLLIRTKISGVSAGTEMHMYNGSMQSLKSESYSDLAYGSYPAVPGYENVGEVVEVGKDVRGVSVGDRVVSCGAHLEYVCVPRRDTLPLWAKVPDDVTDEEATLAVLGTTAAHCIRRAKIQYGDNVAVIGLGVVGMLAALHAKNAGAGKVIGIDVRDYKLKVGKRLGLDVGVNSSSEDLKKRVLEETNGLGADIVIEAVGSGGRQPTTTIKDAYRIVREMGRVMLLGWHMAPAGIVFADEPFIKEADLIMSRGTGPGGLSGEEVLENMPTYIRWTSGKSIRFVLDSISKKKLQLEPLITHRFNYNEIRTAYEMIDKAKEDYLQVVLRWK